MNILLLTPDFPPKLGGVAEYAFQLAAHLKRQGQTVCVVTQPIGEGAGEVTWGDDIAPIRHEALRLWWRRPGKMNSPMAALRTLNWLRYQANYVRAASSLYVEIDRASTEVGGFDFALLTWLSPAAADYALRLSRVKSLPYCVLVHGKEVTALVDRCDRGDLDVRDRMLLETLYQAERIFCASAFTRGEALKLGLEQERVGVLHPAISGELIGVGQQAPGQPRSRPDGRRTLLVSLGRLVERKGYDQAIFAVERLLERGVEVNYAILGDGPARLRLQKLVDERGLRDRISIAGSITEDQKRQWLSEASLFVLPVRELADRDVEGYGIVFLEAAAFGVPAIAGRSGGAPEAVLDGETGLVVDPENVDEIARAIERVLADSSLHERLSRQARAHAAQQTWDRVAERFLAETRQLFEVEHAGC